MGLPHTAIVYQQCMASFLLFDGLHKTNKALAVEISINYLYIILYCSVISILYNYYVFNRVSTGVILGMALECRAILVLAVGRMLEFGRQTN